MDEGKAAEGRFQPSFSIALLPFPKNTYSYLAPDMTLVKTVFLSEAKKAL